MDKFVYDETFDFYSSVLEGIYYNSENKKVALDIKGKVYVYDNVPREAVVELADAPSVGRQYHDFQSYYGPATYFGPWSDKTLVASPRIDLIRFHDEASDKPVKLPVPEKERYSFDLYYLINGQELVFTTQAQTLQQAVDSLTELLSMLGVGFHIEKAVATFE